MNLRISINRLPCRRLRRLAVRACQVALLGLLVLVSFGVSQRTLASEQDLISQCKTTLKTTSMTAPVHSDFAATRVAKAVGTVDAQIEAVTGAMSLSGLSPDIRAALEQCRSDLYVQRVKLEERLAELRATGPVRLMSGTEIRAALVDQLIQGEQNGQGWTQKFNGDGSTSFSFGRRISDGRWKIEIDDYCSQWPPSEAWECWKVETRPNGFAFVSRETGEVWAAQPYVP